MKRAFTMKLKNIFYHLSSRAYFDFFVEGKRPTLIRIKESIRIILIRIRNQHLKACIQCY